MHPRCNAHAEKVLATRFDFLSQCEQGVMGGLNPRFYAYYLDVYVWYSAFFMYAGGGVWADEWARCSRAGHSACEPVPTYAHYIPCQLRKCFVVGETSRERNGDNHGEGKEKMGQLSCCMRRRGCRMLQLALRMIAISVHTYTFIPRYNSKYTHIQSIYTHR